MNSRELVYSTLEFRNETGTVPQQLWVLPWATNNFKDKIENIMMQYPSDIIMCPDFLNNDISTTVGDPYVIGEHIDRWGCIFTNKQNGIIGEVKEPIVTAEDWSDSENVRIPIELLDLDTEKINNFCKEKNSFIMGAMANPFERLQFIRGTEALYIDLLEKPEKMIFFIKKMHAYYCELFENWAKTDVDALMFMDDWGSQISLLINPTLWDEIFRPMYQDYINIAHKHGKKIFMHSDGYILDIIPRLIDMGLDALNSQIFCMGLDKLKVYKGKITFWGEIDRQNLLPYGTLEDIENAVISVKNALWVNGGCIAQCEFGPGAKPENVQKVFEVWKRGK